MLLLLLLAAGCKFQKPDGTLSTNRPESLPPEVSEKLAAFKATPDEAHFQEVVALAKNSTDTRLSTLVDYVEYSKKCMPVDDPTVNLAEVKRRLKGTSPNDYRLIEEMMTRHSNLWRRWTMARFLGEFGYKSSIPALQKMFNDQDQFVQNTAREAVSAIQSR